MLIVATQVKTGVYSCSDEKQIDMALQATKVALRELERLADEMGFAVTLFTIHPYQELDGSYRVTERLFTRAPPPAFTYFFTGDRFRTEHYYPYDGHFNAKGHANMASILEHNLIR
jgi:hypothetical protein